MNSADPTDENLMAQYLSGDSLAFEELYRRHAPKVFSYFFRRTRGDRELTDELHQMAFLKFHQSRASYDSKYPVLQWLYVISKTTLVDHFRKTGRQVPVVHDLTPEEIDRQSPPVSQKADLSALDQLPKEQRQIVEWRFLDDESYDEIARRLGKSQAGVRQIISRALRKIRSSGSARRSEV